MSDIEKAAAEYMAEFRQTNSYQLIHSHIAARLGFEEGIAWRDANPSSEVLALVARIKLVTECRCDKAYTERGRHEPNAWCGEADAELTALEAAMKDVGE